MCRQGEQNGLRSFVLAPREASARRESSMFFAIESATQGGKHSFKVAAQQPSSIEPKARKFDAFEQTIRIGDDLLVPAFVQMPPDYALLAGNPRQVLPYAIASISI